MTPERVPSGGAFCFNPLLPSKIIVALASSSHSLAKKHPNRAGSDALTRADHFLGDDHPMALRWAESKLSKASHPTDIRAVF
jgi:hypothetical protein